MARLQHHKRFMIKTPRALIGSMAVMGCVCPLLYAYLLTSESGSFPTLQNVSGFMLSVLPGMVVGLLIYYVNQGLDLLLSWRARFAVRFFAGFLSYVSLSFLIIAGFSAALFYLDLGHFLWSGFSITDDDLAWKLIIVLLVGSFLYSVIYSILFSYNQYAFAQLELLQQERKQHELQFEALKSQLSPHYLFNSLNTISSLLYNDPQTAEQFIRRLSQSFQYILSTQQKSYISLQEEIEFVKSYFYLLRIRFQNMLTLEINIPNRILNSPIPPLTLQLLLENAVKHNPITSDKPLHIYISAIDHSQIKIINTKSSNESGKPHSTRVGLENIRQRYRYFTNKKIEIQNEEQFTVLLPVLSGMPDDKQP